MEIKSILVNLGQKDTMLMKNVYKFNELKFATKQNRNYVWIELPRTIKPKVKKTNSETETNSKKAGKRYYNSNAA